MLRRLRRCRLMLFTECNALKSAMPSTPSTTASPSWARPARPLNARYRLRWQKLALRVQPCGQVPFGGNGIASCAPLRGTQNDPDDV